ncbi:hypothetical protein N7527_004295 [Penicillium freii]|nr:hypothetical protein N7527_004295 [Penicillium freii]
MRLKALARKTVSITAFTAVMGDMSTSSRRITGVSGRERGESIAGSRTTCSRLCRNPHMNGTILSNIPKGHWEKADNAHGSVVGLQSLGAKGVVCCYSKPVKLVV